MNNKHMSEETKFVGANIINDVAHIFNEEEIAYICAQGIDDLNLITGALGKLPATSIAEGLSLDVLIGEVKQGFDAKEPNVIDPTDPKNLGEESAPSVTE
jgi:hypothetical protein